MVEHVHTDASCLQRYCAPVPTATGYSLFILVWYNSFVLQAPQANAPSAPTFPSTPIPLVLQPRRLFSDQSGSSGDDPPSDDPPPWLEIPLDPFSEDDDGVPDEQELDFPPARSPAHSPARSPPRISASSPSMLRSPSPRSGAALAAARISAIDAMRSGGSATPTSDVATPDSRLPAQPPTPGAPGSGMRRTMTHVGNDGQLNDCESDTDSYMMVELSQILTAVSLGSKRTFDDAL